MHDSPRAVGTARVRRLPLSAIALAITLAVIAGACGAVDETSGAEPPPASARPAPATATPTVDPAVTPAPGTVPTPNPVPAEPPPNVVVFLTDDQTVEQMRVLEQTNRLLTDSGVSFTRSYVNYPTCCPSRATLLTGQHASNHGVIWNALPTGGFQAFVNQQTALPVVLQNAGYRTTFLGKYLNGFGFREADRYVPPGWTDFRGLVAPTEVLYVGSSVYDNGVVRYLGPDAYITDVLTDWAIEAIGRDVALGAPFFLLVGHVAPHLRSGMELAEYSEGRLLEQLEGGASVDRVAVPAPRHAGAFATEPLPRGAAFDEADVSDKPGALRRRPLTAETIAAVERSYRTELETLLAVDESVAAIIGELEAQGVLDETYLIFTSDNGFFHGEHRFATSKYFPYEPTIKVPLVIAGPGLRAGVQEPSLVSNVDLTPTILDMARGEPLRAPNGRSLLPLLRGDVGGWQRAVYLEGHAPLTPLRPQYAGVHTGETVYLEYSDGGRELYDLVIDPDQLTNVVDDPAYAGRLARSQRLLTELRGCFGELCAGVGFED